MSHGHLTHSPSPSAQLCVGCAARLPTRRDLPELAACVARTRDRLRLRRVALAITAVAAVGAAAGLVRIIVEVPVGFALAGAVAAALATAVRRGPSDVAILAQIDRALGLHDLLSTAATIEGDDAAARFIHEKAALAASAVDVPAIFDDPHAIRRLTTAGLALAASVACMLTLAPQSIDRDPKAGAAASAMPAGVPGHESEDALREFPRRDVENASAEPASAAEATPAKYAATPTAGRSDGAGMTAGMSTSAMPLATPRVGAIDATATEAMAGLATANGGRDVRGVAWVGGLTASPASLDVAPAAVDVTPASGTAGVAIDGVPAASRDLVRAFFSPEGRP